MLAGYHPGNGGKTECPWDARESPSLSLNLENQEESQGWERMATRNVILPPTLEGGKTCVV